MCGAENKAAEDWQPLIEISMGILWLATEAKLSRNDTVHKQVLGERHKATFVSTYQCVPKVRKFLGVRWSVTTHERMC